MEKGNKVAIVCCSNGQNVVYQEKIHKLKETLIQIGLIPVFSNYIYAKENCKSGTAKERADSLMEFYKDSEIKAIFDISGGDMANEILPYLDFDIIACSDKQFWGYSDLTTVINAIYAKTVKTSILYQIRNLIYKDSQVQIRNFTNTVIHEKTNLYNIDIHLFRGRK